MNITPLKQSNYTKADINPQTGRNSACVLTACQMWLSSYFGKTWSQNVFYDKALRASIIRSDAYINSYDRLFKNFRPYTRFTNAPTWQFIDELTEIHKQIRAKRNPLLFLGGHCVLADDFSENGMYIYVYDPFDGKRKELTRQIKRAGLWL